MIDTNTTKVIEIVSHCYGGDLPIYPHLLRAQGLSLIHLSQHKCSVVWTICYDPDEKAVVGVLDELEAELAARRVKIRRIPLPIGHIFERAIGRNIAAMSTDANCVWFCDCDYLFAGGCLDDAIKETDLYYDCIVFPQVVSVTSHVDGDAIIHHMEAKQPLAVDVLSTFGARSEMKAIGGIQIVSGELAKSRGYLNEWLKWMKPATDTSKGNFSTRSDVKYRSYIGKSVPRGFAGTHRIRHSHRSYGGMVVDGSE